MRMSSKPYLLQILTVYFTHFFQTRKENYFFLQLIKVIFLVTKRTNIYSTLRLIIAVTCILL